MNSDTKDLLATIGTLVVLLSFVSWYYGAQYIPNTAFTGIKYYEQPKGNSAHVIVTEPSIVIRVDDITDSSYPAHEMVFEILRRNLSVTLAVIADRIDANHPYHDFLYETAQNPVVEIAVHGSNHSTDDINISEEKLAEGFEKTVMELGVVPVTYIPPYNSMTEEAQARASKHYHIISRTGAVFKSGHYSSEVGQTVETYDYERLDSTKQGPSDITKIVEDCRQGIKKNNLCVVTFHPQELSTNMTNATDVNATNYIHFLATIDALQKLNATFITLKDTTRWTKEE